MTDNYEEGIKRYIFTVQTAMGKTLGEGILNKKEVEEEGIELEMPVDADNVKYVPLGSINAYGLRITAFMLVRFTGDKLIPSVRLRFRLGGDIVDIALPEDEVRRFFRIFRKAIYRLDKINSLNRVQGCTKAETYFNQLTGDTLSTLLARGQLYNLRSGQEAEREKYEPNEAR